MSCNGKSQLASVLVMAAVACGGRGGEEPSGTVAGPTDVPQIEKPVPAAQGTLDATQAIDAPVPVDPAIGVPQPIQNPVPVDGRRAPPAPAQDPAPVGASAMPRPRIEDWQARAPGQYVITTCGEGAGIPSCAVEAVDHGRLVSRSTRFLPSEPWASAPIDDVEEPVASLFAEAQLSIDGCTTSFKLDPVYAYPFEIYFSCGQEGWGSRVTCFEPDTLDASRCP